MGGICSRETMTRNEIEWALVNEGAFCQCIVIILLFDNIRFILLIFNVHSAYNEVI